MRKTPFYRAIDKKVTQEKLIHHVDDTGYQSWKNSQDKLHRLSGPAIINAQGDKFWFQNGISHREDGPAVEFNDGGYEYHLNGKHHRIGGPSIEYNTRSRGFIFITVDIPNTKGSKKALFCGMGKSIWAIHGKFHREDGPAVIFWNGLQVWCINDKPHRTDGPAVIHPNGQVEYWENGIKIK